MVAELRAERRVPYVRRPARGEHVRYLGVELLFAEGRHRVVEAFAHVGVEEVYRRAPAVADLAYHLLPKQRVERLFRNLRLLAEHRGELLRLRAAAEGREREHQGALPLRHSLEAAHYEPLEAVAAVGVFVFHQNPHHLREQQRHAFALADEIFLAAAAYDLVGEEGAAVFYYLRPAEGRERDFERAHTELRLYVAQHPLRRGGAFGARGHEYHGGYLQLGKEDAQRVEGFVVEPVQVLEYKYGLAAVAEALRKRGERAPYGERRALRGEGGAHRRLPAHEAVKDRREHRALRWRGLDAAFRAERAHSGGYAVPRRIWEFLADRERRGAKNSGAAEGRAQRLLDERRLSDAALAVDENYVEASAALRELQNFLYLALASAEEFSGRLRRLRGLAYSEEEALRAFARLYAEVGAQLFAVCVVDGDGLRRRALVAVNFHQLEDGILLVGLEEKQRRERLRRPVHVARVVAGRDAVAQRRDGPFAQPRARLAEPLRELRPVEHVEAAQRLVENSLGQRLRARGQPVYNVRVAREIREAYLFFIRDYIFREVPAQQAERVAQAARSLFFVLVAPQQKGYFFLRRAALGGEEEKQRLGLFERKLHGFAVFRDLRFAEKRKIQRHRARSFRKSRLYAEIIAKKSGLPRSGRASEGRENSRRGALRRRGARPCSRAPP